jgi:putative amidoligase enzyme
MSNVGKVVGQPPDQRTFRAAEGLVLSKCFVGIEVEVENFKPIPYEKMNSRLSELWEVVRDGSLRNNGAELRFIDPLFGEDIIDAVHVLETEAKKYKWLSSPRAGTHIHLDVRNLEFEELEKMCLLYCFAEPLFFAVGDPTRANSNFCVPWGKEQETMETMVHVKRASGDVKKKSTMAGFEKYSALNLRALIEFGTVEFRHFPSTSNAEDLLLWINMAMCLKRGIREFEEEGQNLIDSISQYGPRDWLQRLFWPKGVITKIVDRCPDYEQMVWDSLRTAQFFANMEAFLFSSVPRSCVIDEDADFEAFVVATRSKDKEPVKPKKASPKKPPKELFPFTPPLDEEPI